AAERCAARPRPATEAICLKAMAKKNVVVKLEGIPGLNDPKVVVFLLDGKAISREELSRPIRLAVGEHELTTQDSDGVERSSTLSVSRKDNQKTIDVAQVATTRSKGPAKAASEGSEGLAREDKEEPPAHLPRR